MSTIRRAVLRLLLLIGVSMAFWRVPETASAGTPLYPCDRERLGYGVLGGIANYDVAPLRAGWYVNWGTAHQAAHPAGMDFAQLVSTSNSSYSPNGVALTNIIDRNPGSLWLIGNEPDSPYLDNVTPENYARVYHDAYLAIKSQDPLAQVAIGGIVQATPLRLKWLDKVWSEYQSLYGQPIPVDVWNVHGFVLREVRPGHGRECYQYGPEWGDWGANIPPGIPDNCGLWITMDEHDSMSKFAEQIVRFRTWMRDHGQQDKPLVVSEYGILFNEELGYNYPRVRDFMLATFKYFMSTSDKAIGYPADEYRLVQRWAWYSLDDTSFSWGTTHSALMDPQTRAMLLLGQDFADYASRLSCPAYVDLQPFRFSAVTLAPIPHGQPGVVRLTMEVRNQGNAASGPSRVRFWDGNPDAGGTLLGTAAVAALPSRYQGMVTATVDWPVVASGNHLITVQVDALNQVTESREDNNRSTWSVDFGEVNLAVTDASWQVIRGPLRADEATEIALGPAKMMVTQVKEATPGLEIVPPPVTAIWYDGDPAAGGNVIAAQPVATPTAFGQETVLPLQSWAPRITKARSVWLVVLPQNGAPETNSADNHVVITVPATVDLTLSQVRQTAVPLSQPGDLRDVSLRFKVANLGAAAPTGPVQVSVWPNGQAIGPELGRVKLAATGDWTNPLDWTALGVGAHPFVARIDPDNVVSETNEANNDLFGQAIVARERTRMPLVLR